MPARTVSQLEAILGTGEYRYFAPGGTFIAALAQVLPRLYEIGLWRDLTYEVSMANPYGYISLPPDTDSVLACTVDHRPRPTRSMWHDVRISGRQATLSSFQGIVDDGYHPVLLDMKDVQGVDTAADVTDVDLLRAIQPGTSVPVAATGYAGGIVILGTSSTGKPVTFIQSTSGFLEFGTSSVTSASLTVDPTGADNNFVVTSFVPGVVGNDITFALTTPASAAITVTETDNDVVVAAGAKHTMTIVVAGEEVVLVHNGEFRAPNTGATALPVWTVGGLPLATALSGSAPKGALYADRSGWFWEIQSTAVGTVNQPPSGVFIANIWPDVTHTQFEASAPTAAEVIAAINAQATLVTAAASGNVTGVVAAVDEAPLAGGAAGEGVTAFTSITYDDVPSEFYLIDPDFPTKVVATVPAGSGVLRFRRFRTPSANDSSVVHLLVKRSCPLHLTSNTIVHLGNIGAIKHGLLGLIAEDNGDLDRAGFHWGMAGKLLDTELLSILGSAKPVLVFNDPAATPIRNML